MAAMHIYKYNARKRPHSLKIAILLAQYSCSFHLRHCRWIVFSVTAAVASSNRCHMILFNLCMLHQYFSRRQQIHPPLASIQSLCEALHSSTASSSKAGHFLQITACSRGPGRSVAHDETDGGIRMQMQPKFRFTPSGLWDPNACFMHVRRAYAKKVAFAAWRKRDPQGRRARWRRALAGARIVG
eukprot:6189391-Pleurochrysis_carterae.AAC.1